MRALEVLHDQLRESTGFMHAARWNALWRTVLALLAGKKLWLTALGRALPGDAGRKHAIKAVDRLLGNVTLYCERRRIAASLAAQIIGQRGSVVVLIDTVEVRDKVVGFVASVAHQGRGIPIWSTAITALRANTAHCRTFLTGLQQVLPPTCRPILLTDGGFERTWFDQIEALGWDYVGRVRGMVKVQHRGQKFSCPDLHRMAGRRAKTLRNVRFPVKHPHARRLVLSKLPVCRHRQTKTRRGPGRDNNYRHYRKNAYEPLVLATSLASNAQAVVNVYRTRMQIEQTFRDLKNHRWGWSLRHYGSRSGYRLEILLLIAAIATFVQQLVGIAGEHAGIHRQHQANTLKKRRVLSYFFLGGLIIANERRTNLSPAAIKRALALLRREISGIGRQGNGQ
jgi:hypothetical protein